ACLWVGMVGLASAAPARGRAAPPAAPATTATIVLYPIADSDVVLSSTSNFGAASDLHVDYDPSGSTTFSRALLQFSMADLAYQLPAGATVLTATLKCSLSVAAP